MQRGCLSDIEPSGGTGHNEALHRHVNPNFSHAGRMGITLAYALLSILFYRHNMKKEKQETGNVILTRLITRMVGTACDSITSTEFGIVGKSNDGRLGNWLTGDCSTEYRGCELTSDEDPAMISVHDIEALLKKALSSADLAASMYLIIKGSPKFSYRMPFMSSFISEVQNQHCLNMHKCMPNALHIFWSLALRAKRQLMEMVIAAFLQWHLV